LTGKPIEAGVSLRFRDGVRQFEMAARTLRKDPRVTAIIVKSVDAADWFAGGKSLAEQSLGSFWLDVHVSEGTNTKDEKAAYLAAARRRRPPSSRAGRDRPAR
jgi:4-oxalocrotonate tautomerase